MVVGWKGRVGLATSLLDTHELGEGDGAAVSNKSCIEVTAKEPAEVLLFDLA